MLARIRPLRPALVLVALALALLLDFVPLASAAPDRYILPGNAVFPEGIAFQPSTGNFFVSSTTDGTIFRGNIESGEASPFLPGGADGRTTAIGLRVDDARGRLFIAGGGTGLAFVYNTASGALLGRLVAAPNPGQSTPTFINDVAVVPNGDAFFTDSQRPFLYRVSAGGQGATFAVENFVDFTGTALVYQQGFNVNGIVASADGRYLIVVQSNTGKLFRVTIATKAVSEIDLGGQTVTNGDGLVLDGQTLYVVRNQQGLIVTIQLRVDFSSGTVVSSTGDPLLAYPTTAAKAGDRLLVVNSQFDKRGQGQMPVLPFTVANIAAPPADAATLGTVMPGMPNTGGGAGTTIPFPIGAVVVAGLVVTLGGVAYRVFQGRRRMK